MQVKELPQIEVEALDLYPNKDEGQLRVAKSQSMFLSLNTDKKIACFESFKENDGQSNDNFLSTNSRSNDVDIGMVFNNK